MLIFLSASIYAQEKSKFIYVDLADKSATLYPFYTIYGYQYDPAVSLGAGLDHRQKNKKVLFQTVQLTGYSTEIIGKGVTLTTSFGYRFGKASGLFAEGMLGIGASLFKPSRESFSQNEDGIYVPVYSLHMVAALPIDILLGYSIGKYAFVLKYRYMIIGPYAEAMPAAPVSLIGIGARYNLSLSD